MSEATDAPFLRVNFGDRGELVFATFDEFRSWFHQEKQFFDNLASARNSNTAAAQQLLQPRWQALQNWVNQIQLLANEGDIPRHVINDLSQGLLKTYGNDSFFFSDDPRAIFLKELHERRPEEAGAALRLLLGKAPDAGLASSYRGAVALALYEEGIAGSAESDRSALRAVYVDGKRQVATLKGHITRLEKLIQRFTTAQQEALTDSSRQHQQLTADHSEALKKNLEDAGEKLAAHELAYSEKLALHSAVKYWKRQEDRRTRQAKWVGSGFAASLAAAASLLSYFSNGLLAGEITPQKVGAILLTVSPIFWGLRVLARLLLSYMHLGTDASERQILIETYLALQKEGKIGDDDREFLLAAVFRPASTGIVRDDAAPAWSDIFSKLGGK